MGTDGNWLLWTAQSPTTTNSASKSNAASAQPADGEWPDKGTRLNVYTNPDRGGQPYVEMEVMGAMQIMKVSNGQFIQPVYAQPRCEIVLPVHQFSRR